MAEMIKACLDIVLKATNEETRVLSFIGSTGDVDRDGEVIEPKGWDLKNYKKNPVFLWGHNSNMPPIGKAQKVKKGEDGLHFDVKFATEEEYPFADTVYRLFKGGYLNATSVGFIPVKWEDGNPQKNEPRRRYTKTELLELSAVTVPSNFNALMQRAVDEGAVTQKAFDTMIFPDAANNDTANAVDDDEPDNCELCGKEVDVAVIECCDECLASFTVKEDETVVMSGNIPFKAHEVLPVDTPWDFRKAYDRTTTWAYANFDKLAKAFAYNDEVTKTLSGIEDDLHFLHHDIRDGALVTNFKGVAQAMHDLLMTDDFEGKEEAYNHLKQHYSQFDKEPPELGIFEQAEIKELFEDADDVVNPDDSQVTQADIATEATNELDSEDNDLFKQIFAEAQAIAVPQQKPKTENLSELTELAQGIKEGAAK